MQKRTKENYSAFIEQLMHEINRIKIENVHVINWYTLLFMKCLRERHDRRTIKSMLAMDCGRDGAAVINIYHST